MRLNHRRRSVSFALIAAIALFTTVCESGAPQIVISGEVVEMNCWARLGIGGVAHASCGIECAKHGIPVGIYDAQSRTVFILLPARDKSAVPQDLIAAMGRRVNVRGDVIRRAGSTFLAVQSWEPSS
jgi:hypothetical protein